MASGLHKFGGIVYVYTKDRILFWTPNAANGHLVYVGGIWGSGQNYQISDAADVVITVYYVGGKSTFTSSLYLLFISIRKLFTLPEHLSSLPVFSEVQVNRSLLLCACFVDRCLYLFFWPLCCLFFFDLRILITSSVSSNSLYCFKCFLSDYIFHNA
jgi:hypothetical protein